MKNLKSLKWELGLVATLALVIAFNGIKASPEFDQAVLTASSQNQSQTSKQSNAKDQSSINQGTSNSNEKPSSPSNSYKSPNSQFNNSNSYYGNSSNQSQRQSPSRVPHTRSGRS